MTLKELTCLLGLEIQVIHTIGRHRYSARLIKRGVGEIYYQDTPLGSHRVLESFGETEKYALTSLVERLRGKTLIIPHASSPQSFDIPTTLTLSRFDSLS